MFQDAIFSLKGRSLFHRFCGRTKLTDQIEDLTEQFRSYREEMAAFRARTEKHVELVGACVSWFVRIGIPLTATLLGGAVAAHIWMAVEVRSLSADSRLATHQDKLLQSTVYEASLAQRSVASVTKMVVKGQAFRLVRRDAKKDSRRTLTLAYAIAAQEHINIDLIGMRGNVFVPDGRRIPLRIMENLPNASVVYAGNNAFYVNLFIENEEDEQELKDFLSESGPKLMFQMVSYPMVGPRLMSED